MAFSFQISSFDANLFDSKILCHAPDSIPDIFTHVNNIREPFRKKILVCSSSVIIKDDFNAVFHPRDTQDWSIVATAITYSSKPLLLVVEDIDIPDTLWKKIPPKGVTLVHIITKWKVGECSHYNTFFFTKPDDTNIYPLLKQILGTEYQEEGHNQLVHELQKENAGIVVHAGKLFWNENDTTTQPFSKEQLSYLFKTLSKQFQISQI